MSVTQRPETLNSQHVQVWDNAAFDNGESEAIKLSWSNLNSAVSVNLSESFESKENQCPPMASPVSTTSLASVKPLHPNTTITNTQTKIPSVPEDKRLDSEIEAIEKEINRLSSRLESLKLEKAKRTAKTPGKIAPLKTPRRGLSMDPAEMLMTTGGVRRGISIGPAEIYSATKLKQFGKQEITTTTPIPPPSSRRKSCYWKLQDIDELRVAKEIRGKSLTLSPKSRNKTRVQPAAATTTIGSKKSVKKDEGIISSIQPKKLFTSSTNDGEKSGKKPLKNGRVVPSRYTQISNSGIRKRRSLSESNDEDSKRKRASLAGTSRVLTTAQKSVEDKTTTTTTPLLSVSKRLNVRTFRSVDESPSPRDSGPAKRVSQLVGRKSYFSMDDDDEEDMPVFSFEVETAEEEN